MYVYMYASYKQALYYKHMHIHNNFDIPIERFRFWPLTILADFYSF